MKKKILFVAGISCVLLIHSLYAAEQRYWPTWRGPDMNGISPDGNPPIQWSETENIKWKVELEGDNSNSSPIIWGNKIFFQTAVQTDRKAESEAASAPAAEEGRGAGRGRGGRGGGAAPSNYYTFNLVCLDRNTGKPIWQKTVCEVVPHERHHGDHGFASYTPVTDGKLLWANFGSRGLYCYDVDGNKKWSRELGEYNIRASFGEGGSLAVAGDKVIVVKDHEGDSSIAAFDKKTGKPVWKKDRDEKTSWSTPLVMQVDGKPQVIVNATNRIRSYNPDNGEVIWECGGMTQNVIPTPIPGKDRVYCTSGFRGSALLAIELGRTGDLTGTDAIAWQVDKGTPYVPSGLLYEDKLYVFAGNNPVLSCYNAETGQPYYTETKLEEIKNVYASPVGVSGRVYMVGRNGVTYVLDNAESLKVLAVNKLDDGIDCSPAVIGDTLYLKGKKHLYCIAESK